MAAHLLRWVPVLVLMAGTAACSTSPPAPQPTPMGRTFLSTAIAGPPIPGGGPLTLTFADGRISANAGCNTSSGTVIFDGNMLRVGRLATTDMGCLGERAGADAWQTGLLRSTPAWRLDGATLTLSGDHMTVTLLDKKVARPDLPLTRTTWIVTTLLRPEGEVRSRKLEEVLPTLTISPDGWVSGDAGCNRMTGTAGISPDGTRITFQLGTTRMMCAPEVMDIEGQVLQALNGTVTATIDYDTLRLENTANGTGLVFRAD